jgi:putative MFS transporter
VKEGLTIVQSLGFTTLMAFGAPGGAVIGFLCADRLGRARGLVVFAIATIAVGFVYPNMHAGWAISLVGFVLITCIYTVATLGLFAYIPELFPTELRLRGTGTAGVCGRAASMTTPYFAVLLYNSFGVSGVLAMVSGVLALLVVGILLLRVETNQHALEQISPSLDTQSDPMPATQQG